VDDWDAEQERRANPSTRVSRRGLTIALVGLVVITIAVGLNIRFISHQKPSATLSVSVADAARGHQNTAGPDGTAPDEDDAAAERAARLLLGDGGLIAGDPNALHLAAGQPLILSDQDAQIEVTPKQVSVGTDDCAPGPLVTVNMSVKVLSGYATPALVDFSMRDADGTTVLPLLGCSTGFSEEAEQRTLVFGAAQPGRLVYGPDVTAPEGIWRLS
jgi:hypothetical protein